jgi:hypothetical protein
VAALLACPAVSSAGGSWASVEVSSLRLMNETDYELVVVPEPNTDPYLGKCKTFTVLGTYTDRPAGGRWWHFWSRFPESVTRKGHVAALSQIAEARASNRPLNFGWIGAGFSPVDPSNLCVVRSRALETVREGESIAVVSYHDAV